MINGIDHVGLSVSNLEKSIDFYTKIMGLKLIRTIDADPNTKLGEVTGLDNCHARIAHLEGNGMMLELFQYIKPLGEKIPSYKKQADIGLIHVGFKTDDARSDYLKLRKFGVKVISKPVEFRSGVWVFYFYGPDNEVCDLRET